MIKMRGRRIGRERQRGKETGSEGRGVGTSASYEKHAVSQETKVGMGWVDKGSGILPVMGEGVTEIAIARG